MNNLMKVVLTFEKGSMNWDDYFYYDETSPSCLRWKVEQRSGKGYRIIHKEAGSTAGYIHTLGYYRVMLNGVTYSVHRIVWWLFNGLFEHDVIDHINGKREDNRIENLRCVTQYTNTQNACMSKRNKSGVTGVSRKTSTNRLGVEYRYWRAGWKGIDGKGREKMFSISKYGEDGAFEMACKYREKMIQELNSEGMQYTDRHGKG